MPDLISSQLVENQEKQERIGERSLCQRACSKTGNGAPPTQDQDRNQVATLPLSRVRFSADGHVKFWCRLPHPSSEQHTVSCADLSKNTTHRVGRHCLTPPGAHVIHAVDHDNSWSARRTDAVSPGRGHGDEKGRQQRRRRFRRTRWFLMRFRIDGAMIESGKPNTRICQICATLSHLRGSLPWVGLHPSSPAGRPPRRRQPWVAVCGPPWVPPPPPAPTPPRCSVGGPPPFLAVPWVGPLLLAVPWVGPHPASLLRGWAPTPPRRPCGFVGLLHRPTSLSCPCRHQSLPADDLCPCCWWIKPAQGKPVKNFVMEGDSMRPSKKWLGIPVASRLPVAEGETLAIGVSTRMLEVMDVGSLRTEASQSPEVEGAASAVEGETLAVGVSTRVLREEEGGTLRTVASRSIGAEGSLMIQQPMSFVGRVAGVVLLAKSATLWGKTTTCNSTCGAGHS